jgi:hypothetical protein
MALREEREANGMYFMVPKMTQTRSGSLYNQLTEADKKKKQADKEMDGMRYGKKDKPLTA